MSDVFVSYKAEDRRRVKPLVEALEADGYSVWWDEQIGGGSVWRHEIEAELNAAKCVLVVWSKRSVGPDGTFVQDEATRAQQRHVYVPVTIDKVHVPLGFGETQALPLTGWHGSCSDARYQAVLAAIGRITGDETHAPLHRTTSPMPLGRRTVLAGGAVAATAAAGVGGWMLLKPGSAAASTRIAVLPFANLSGDPAQAYFSDGLAEEVRNALSRIPQLKVMARTSSEKVRDDDIQTAARKLDVGSVLTGSVRRSPSTIRVNAQLIDGKDGVERWSEAYDRPAGDVLEVQADIAQKVAAALSIQLTPGAKAALTIGGTSNPAALDLFLRVERDRDADNQAGVERRLALLDAALSLDPNYAEAYARKAALLSVRAGTYAETAIAANREMAEALTTANRAIAIAPGMARAYAVRSGIHRQRLQIGLAWADVRHAVSLSGEDAIVLGNYANLLSRIGRSREALRLSNREIAIDPLSPGSHGNRAGILYHARRYAEAVTSARRSLQLAPSSENTRSVLGNALLAEGKLAEAQAEYSKLDPVDYRRLVGEAVIAARTGRRSVALDKLRALHGIKGDVDHYQYGEIYAQLGQIDDAFKELGLAWEVRDSGLARMRVDPFLDPLRADPRFAMLERKLNFPQTI